MGILFFYDINLKKGNENNFKTIEECQSDCKSLESSTPSKHLYRHIPPIKNSIKKDSKLIYFTPKRFDFDN